MWKVTMQPSTTANSQTIRLIWMVLLYTLQVTIVLCPIPLSPATLLVMTVVQYTGKGTMVFSITLHV